MKLSLRHKTVLIIVIITFAISTAAILVSRNMMNRIIDDNYRKRAIDVSKTVSVMIDEKTASRLQQATADIYDSIKQKEKKTGYKKGSSAHNGYISHFISLLNTEDYMEIRNELRKMEIVNDVSSIYFVYLDKKDENFVYITDAAYEDPSMPGTIMKNDKVRKSIRHSASGIPAFYSGSDDDPMVTAGAPVHSISEEVIGYVMADVSLAKIKSLQKQSRIILVAITLSVAFIVILIAFIYVNRSVVKPIKRMSDAAKRYKDEHITKRHTNFSELDIRTGDEIEMLADSMKQMESDINDYITSLLDMSNELSIKTEEADQMNTLARRDALTGIRNKRAYDEIILELEAQLAEGNIKSGIAIADLNGLKKINDTYGHEYGDAAIKKMTKMVCDVFIHSPVFRIGGDEIAIILQNEDFDNVITLIEEFQRRTADLENDENLQPWEKISASIGYALFDPEKDNNMLDVFRKADKWMYLHKKEMKKER